MKNYGPLTRGHWVELVEEYNARQNSGNLGEWERETIGQLLSELWVVGHICDEYGTATAEQIAGIRARLAAPP